MARSPFSPLFIGEDSSTAIDSPSRADADPLSVPSSSGKTLQRLAFGGPIGALIGFQSPLHRGRLFNTIIGVVHTAKAKTFSPLFIGEDSSTADQCCS